MGTTERLWTAEDVAAYLGLHPKTVRTMSQAGRLPSLRIGHRTVRFDPVDVRAFAQGSRRGDA